jgi:hypothetical protein
MCLYTRSLAYGGHLHPWPLSLCLLCMCTCVSMCACISLPLSHSLTLTLSLCHSYVPGWDCHGLPIEAKALERMPKSRDGTLAPQTVRRHARAL